MFFKINTDSKIKKNRTTISSKNKNNKNNRKTENIYTYKTNCSKTRAYL
jgi:hypothetical protein